MEEIFRYQQLRQTQKLSEEQKLLVGMFIYPDKTMSQLANELIELDKSGAPYASIINRYKEKDNKKNVIEDISKIDPLVHAFYDWLNFKAKPIKKDAFKKFVESLNA